MRRFALLVAVLSCALFWGASPAAAAARVSWCGNDRAAANRLPDVDSGSNYLVHVVYATPSDGPDRFDSLASPIATDVAAIDEWWRGQDSTRAPRFDLFAFPNCASRPAQLDIGFARLPRVGSAYAGLNLAQLSADLGGFGTPNVKNLVYYDGPVDDADICGTTGYLADHQGGPYGFAFVWLRAAECEPDVGTGRLTAEVAAHELTHNLGAVPGRAPNQCPDAEGHVCDSHSDLLYPYVSSGASLAGAVLDFGHDDYYGHNGGWWDVQDSPWLMRLPLFQLTATVAGSPGGISSDVGGISCPSVCTSSVENGTMMTFEALPKDQSRFLGWSGACTGREACIVTMDAAKALTATFGPAFIPLSVTVAGKGSVRSSPSGIVCTKACTRQFSADATVRLVAKAAKGYRFAGWSGDCKGVRDCLVKLDRAHSVRATFRKRR
jgi:hypothetical protein